MFLPAPARAPELTRPVAPKIKHPQPESERRKAVLMKAADLIEKYGWQTGNLGDPSEGFCLVGAIAWADQTTPGGYEGLIYGHPFERATRNTGYDAHTLYSWNDNLRWRSARLPRTRGFLGRLGKRVTPQQFVVATLRRMAEGENFGAARQVK